MHKLSQQRADVCVAYLISQGIDAGQLVAKGIGENEPFVNREKKMVDLKKVMC